MPATETVGPRATYIAHATRASALLSVVRAFVNELDNLAAAHAEIGRDRRDRMESAARDIRRRLDRDELWVAVVGEFNAGKSTFLNAVLGARVLGTSVHEFTGVVTVLRHGDEPDYVYETDAGRIVRFADEVPDRRPALRDRARSAEVAEVRAGHELAERRREYEEATVRVQHAGVVLDCARADEIASLRQVDAARLVASERRAHVTHAVFEETQSAALVPAFVRSLPPWWALWLWAARLLLGWVWGRPREAWRVAVDARLATERARGEAEAGLGEWAASAARTGRSRAASEISLQEAGAARGAAEEAVTAAERALAHAGAALKQARDELTRHEGERLAKFVENVRQLAAINRRGGIVRTATIRYPSPLLARGLVLMDTPGLNTPQKQYEERSWAAIERDADACILLTPAGQAMAKSTRDALRRMCQYVPHVALAITKADKVEEDIFSDDPGDVEVQVKEALQECVRRFAQDMGRAESDVVWIATAAERATPGGPSFDPRRAKDFESMLARLTRVLAGERVAVLGVRAARIGEEVAREVRSEVARLEGVYNERIRRLESERLPDQRAEVERIARAHTPTLEKSIEQNAQEAAEAVRSAAVAWFADVDGEIQGAADKDALERFVKNVIETRTQSLTRRCQMVLDNFASACTRAVRAEVRSAVGEVHERYRIVANLGIGEVSVPALQLDLGATQAIGVAQVSAAFGSHLEKEILAGGVGAGAGAAIGTVLLPGVGTVIGGLLGGFAGWLFSPGLGDLKAKVSTGCSSIAERTGHDTCGLLQSLTNRIHGSALSALRETLDDEVCKYNAWIDRVLADEQRRITAERAKVRDLLGRGQRIDAHAAEMTREVAEVARESSMMSRAPRVFN